MKLSVLSLLAILLFSCNNTRPEMDGDYYAEDMEISELKEIPPTEQNAPVNNANQTKKVIKSGNISFQSENIKKDYDRIKALLSTYDSYIDNENETNNDYQANYDITIRVSAINYDSLFSQLAKLSSKIDFKSSNIEDVTAQYYDLKTRIKNKKLLEERYVSLLKKASGIKDILEIERSLNEIRNEIETAEGSYRYLSKQVSYSTIQVNFYEVLPMGQETQNFWSSITTAIGRGWWGFLSSLIEIIQYWPWAIIFTGGFYVYRKAKFFWRKTK